MARPDYTYRHERRRAAKLLYRQRGGSIRLHMTLLNDDWDKSPKAPFRHSLDSIRTGDRRYRKWNVPGGERRRQDREAIEAFYANAASAR
jgi:hypothetical protein